VIGLSVKLFSASQLDVSDTTARVFPGPFFAFFEGRDRLELLPDQPLRRSFRKVYGFGCEMKFRGMVNCGKVKIRHKKKYAGKRKNLAYFSI
jgi:hypothetical protein